MFEFVGIEAVEAVLYTSRSGDSEFSGVEFEREGSSLVSCVGYVFQIQDLTPGPIWYEGDDDMRYNRLGDTELEVSVLGFGTWQLGDPAYWGPSAEADGERAVHAAMDMGVNFFDTAELYGRGESERALGQALGPRRGDAVIASKVGVEHCEPSLLRHACESSLRHLATDYIDLYQIHWPSRDIPFEDTYNELKRLQKEGKIRYMAVSNFGKEDLTAWLEIAHGECASNQLPYNLLFRAIEFEVFPLCREREVAVIPYVPLLQGLLSDRWHSVEDIPLQRRRYRHFDGRREGCRHGEEGCEDLLMETLGGLRRLAAGLGLDMATLSLAWLMAKPGVATVPVGTRASAQLERNVEAVRLELDVTMVAELDRISEPLRERLGPNADLWEGDDKRRIR